MKKIMSLAVMLIAATAMWAQNAVIEFQKTSHDFGKINEADGRVTTVFQFKNAGMAPLVLSEVRASCGCTTPKWTREPVEPGQTGEITVTYNPNGRPGRFQKTITVTSNAETATTKLYIKGEVIPKAATPVDNYPVKMGKLGLKNNTLDFGVVKKGEAITRTLGYANQTNDSLRVECVPAQDYAYGTASIGNTVATLIPNSKGELSITFDAAACRQYGQVEATLFVVVDGVEDKARAITLKADVQEDFSSLDEKALADAPIADISKELNLGTFAQGKKQKAQFNVANAGVNPLIIRRIVANDNRLNIVPAKPVKSGKRGVCRVDMQPMEKGSYSAEVTVITNDPKKAVQQVTLHWTIE